VGHLLLFRLGDSAYALAVEQIQEIVESPPLHFIPRAPHSFLGAINVHGTVLPVLDLVAHLGYPGESRDHRYIVLTADLGCLALAVSVIGRIVPAGPYNFLPPVNLRETESCSRAQFEREGELVHLLDVPCLMTSLTPL
jgi:purine-binding chemotaxis protein CheW